jgi:molecular chaperone GrpE
MKPKKMTQNTTQDTKQHQTISDDAVPVADDAAQTLVQLQDQLAAAQLAVQAAQESERRALADYQNIVRRQQQERTQLIKMATKEVVEPLLEPLNHLGMAAAQLNDTGLNMVVEQLWSALRDQGLTEVDVLGKPFDLETMEVVTTEGSATVVTKVVSKGYSLYGQVIRHAKVVMGDVA